MINLNIGDWANRHYADRRYATTKAHRVGRVSALGYIMTSCGQMMWARTNAAVDNKLLRVIGPNEEEACKRCWKSNGNAA